MSIKDGVTKDGGQATIYMTLRDYLAGQALIAFMSDHSWVMGLDADCVKDGVPFKATLAFNAYAMADAMLAERDK